MSQPFGPSGCLTFNLQCLCKNIRKGNEDYEIISHQEEKDRLKVEAKAFKYASFDHFGMCKGKERSANEEEVKHASYDIGINKNHTRQSTLFHMND